MTEVKLDADLLLKYKKTLIYKENMIVLKIFPVDSIEDSQEQTTKEFNVIVLLDNTIVSIPLVFAENAQEIFQTPNTTMEIQNIYQSYLVTMHEYCLRPDTISEEEKQILSLLKGRIAFYSNSMKQLELLSQINL